MSTIAPLKRSRRRFLKGCTAAAGSLMVGFHVPFPSCRSGRRQ